mgnify:CR=1 FL=1
MKAGIFYFYIHSKIWKWKGKKMKESEFRSALGEAWNIPKKIQPLIKKELELMGMIKQEGINIIMTHPLFDEEDSNFYYEKMGLFENGK